MQGRADKGLVITTGTFTREAIKEATRDGAPPIDLIDGELLCDKLKELKLGALLILYSYGKLPTILFPIKEDLSWSPVPNVVVENAKKMASLRDDNAINVNRADIDIRSNMSAKALRSSGRHLSFISKVLVFAL